MTKLFKKLLLTTATVGAVVTPIATVVSCGQKPEDEKPFTVGVALAPVSTLNYIKYKSATDVSSSLVESLFKGAPASGKPLDVALGLPHVDLIDAGGYIALDTRGFQSGTLRRSAFHKAVGYGPRSGMAPADAKSAVAIWTNNYTYCSHLVMNLNGQSKWANGDKLTSSNFVDYIAYTLDINNGSQKVKEVLDFGIKNTKEFVEAQNAYARVMGRAYPNPFGYVKHALPANATPEVAANWSYYQQMAGQFPTVGNTAEERKLVDEIERSAKGIGIYGDEYSSHPESRNPDTGARLTNEMVDAKEYQIPMPKEDNQATITSGINGGNAVPNTLVGFTSNNSIPEGSIAGLSAMNPYKIDFVPSHPMDSFKFAVLRIASYSKNLIPVNRHWIETHGGVENFGKDEKHILAQGPFKIKESVLGVNGFMMLEKNHSYHAVSEIIPETVKIFFQTDPVVLGTLFDDGYIVDTTIDSIYTKKFFSDLSKRNLIKKNMGWGVTGYVYNLDKGSNKNKALLDPHFRKAINFATERKELIKVSGFDTTEPSYSLIEPSIGMEHWMGSNNAITQGTGHASEEIKYSNTFSAPMMSTSASQSTGILQLFANSNIVDKLHNVAEARREIELFKKNNPSINHVKIKFIHDSSSKMINIALALKSQLKTSFGDFIELDIQGLPKSIYDSYLLEGKYDMTWRNLDFLSVNIPMGAGVDAFFSPDGIEKENAKTIGFQTNPAGSWTFKDAFDYYKAHGITESVRQRLGISTAVWNEIIDLVTVPEALKTSSLSASEIKFIMNKRITAFFDKKPMDLSILPKNFPDSLKTSWAGLNANFDTSTEIAPLVVAANKILMDQGVFTPTFRVDVIIQVDRLPNVNYRASAMNFSYTYDLLRKPYPWLPGLEIKGA